MKRSTWSNPFYFRINKGAACLKRRLINQVIHCFDIATYISKTSSPFSVLVIPFPLAPKGEK